MVASLLFQYYWLIDTIQVEFSMIPVHVWQYNVSDVFTVVSRFASGIRVVSPQEFVHTMVHYHEIKGQ